MSKLTDDDIYHIERCIKSYYVNMIDKEREEGDYTIPEEIYKLQKDNLQEANRLIYLLNSLREEEKS